MLLSVLSSHEHRHPSTSAQVLSSASISHYNSLASVRILYCGLEQVLLRTMKHVGRLCP